MKPLEELIGELDLTNLCMVRFIESSDLVEVASI